MAKTFPVAIDSIIDEKNGVVETNIALEHFVIIFLVTSERFVLYILPI